MDTLDTRLKDFFTPAAPARLARRVLRRLEPGPDLSGLIARFAIEATTGRRPWSSWISTPSLARVASISFTVSAAVSPIRRPPSATPW